MINALHKALGLSAILSLGFTAALYAQTEGLSLGQPVNPEHNANSAPEIGATINIEDHGDWVRRCVQTQNGLDLCHLFQLLLDENENSVASFRIAPLEDPDGQAIAAAEVTTPLATFLQPGVEIAVDGGDAFRYPIAFCSEVGCHARIAFTAEQINGFRRGATAAVTMVPFADPNKRVTVEVSLAGFTAGYAALESAPASATSSSE